MFSAPIRALIDELDALAARRTDALQVPRAEGELLHHIALVTRARRIIEVGTSYGFSGLFWAAALDPINGTLDTIDSSPQKHRSAQETFDRAGLSERVCCHLGDARVVLPALSGAADLVFLDADKASTRTYFDLIWPRVATGGSVITDNVVTHRDELAEFVSYVRARTDAVSIEVAVGNGIEWTVKIPHGEQNATSQ